MIRLAPLDRANGHQVAHIAPFPDQLKYTGDVAALLAEPPARFDLCQVLFCDVPVGVFKIDREYHRSFPVAPKSEIGLRALIIDAPSQNRGIGTAAMRALPAFLAPRYPNSQFVYLTVNLQNLVALKLYAACGFQNTGDIWSHGPVGPQAVLRLPLAGKRMG